MSSYDPYERESSRHYVREQRRDDRDSRYFDTRDYSARPLTSRELVPRGRVDSDLSVEEVRRDFPPPTGRDLRRARSADRDRYYEDEVYDYRQDPSRHDRSRDPAAYDRSIRRGDSYYEEEVRRSKHKSMSKQDKIIAAVAGAALLAGGKELYDRHEAKRDGLEVQRNPLSSVALAGFGALAGYQGAEYYSKQQAVKDKKAQYILHRGRDGHISEYYSDDDDDDDPRRKKGHKNFLENALAATGLGAAVKSLTGGGSPTRSRAGSPHSRSGGSGSGANKIQKAAMASLLAGATEAFRVAKEPGDWRGEKAKRVLTAAAGAATVDAARGDQPGKLSLAESVIGGLVGNRLINGSKNNIEEDKYTGRSQSRSRARSQGGGGGGGGTGLAALATAGLGALGAKAALDSRSRSRSRAESRRSRSYDSRDESPDRHRSSRSRSVVDKARNSLARLGIGSSTAAADAEYSRRDQDDFDDRRSSRRARGGRYSDGYDDDSRYSEGQSRRGDYEYERSPRRGGGGGGSQRDSSRQQGRGGSRGGYGSESDLGDSDEDERKARKMKGKQIITTGLASVATIHAANNVYKSLEAREARQKAVREGRLSAAEAKKLKTQAILKDAASVGLAALGIKGAFAEMKEARALTNECKAFQQEKVKRHEKRKQRRYGRSRGAARGEEEQDRPRRAESWAPSRYRDFDGHDREDYGPQYYDDNPYGHGRLPAPPMGYNG